MAVGRPRFLEMAVDMVLSLRQFDDRPVALGADHPTAELAERRFPGLFTDIRIVPDEFRHHRALKYSAARVTPYDETVFVDADCLILADTDPLWTRAQPAPITMTGEYLFRSDRNRWHQGFYSHDLMDRIGIDRYLKTNSGVFHLRREAALPLLDACHECYREEVLVKLWDGRNPPSGLGDEFAFGITGGRYGFGVYPQPAPTYYTKQILAFERPNPAKPVLHFVAPLPRPALRMLLRDVSRRRADAGYPPNASLAHWRHEAKPPSLYRRAKRWLYRAIHPAPNRGT